MSIPKTVKAWIVKGTGGFDDLVLTNDHPLPEIGDHDVLVKIHAASLNYRDLAIVNNRYPLPRRDNTVACSDGAGEVLAIGPKVTRFAIGAKVLTLFNQAHLSGSLSFHSVQTGLGGSLDGTLRTHGVFDEHGLVALPANLSYLEGATLTCAGLTAWNGLYGLRQLMPGDWVLTQGSGGVSVFALQFAKAAGAKVIATTSSAAKADRLRKLGADHVINYRETPEWGVAAKKLTPGGVGVAHVIEVGGPGTMAQSLKAVQFDGVISVIGFVAAGGGEQPTFLETLSNVCTVRGLLVGSRDQFEEMNRAVEANDIKPVVDDKVFSFEQAKEAYQYQWAAKHFGKVCIKID